MSNIMAGVYGKAEFCYAKFMSTKSTKTIDDLGFQTYVQFEENRKYFDEEFVSQAKDVTSLIQRDSFEPLMLPEYQVLFEINVKGGRWSFLQPPSEYNDQKGRLFVHQLAPKLGPYELIELQISKIEDMRKEEREKIKSGPTSKDETRLKQIDREANTLIQMMQNIQILNTIMGQINSERYRYTKG